MHCTYCVTVSALHRLCHVRLVSQKPLECLPIELCTVLNSSVFWVIARRRVVWNRRFGTTYHSHLQGSSCQTAFQNYLSVPSSRIKLYTGVSELPIDPFFKDQAVHRYFGTTYLSHLQGSSCPPAFRNYLSVPSLRVNLPTGISKIPIGLFVEGQEVGASAQFRLAHGECRYSVWREVLEVDANYAEKWSLLCIHVVSPLGSFEEL